VRFSLSIHEQLDDGRFVVTNCSNDGCQPGPEHTALAVSGAYDIPNGTIFTKLLARRSVTESGTYVLETIRDECVSLKIEEIEFFRKIVDVVPNGHHAAVRLIGVGNELVRSWLSSKPENGFIYLSTDGNET